MIARSQNTGQILVQLPKDEGRPDAPSCARCATGSERLLFEGDTLADIHGCSFDQINMIPTKVKMVPAAALNPPALWARLHPP
jgi:hypothetical protein